MGVVWDDNNDEDEDVVEAGKDVTSNGRLCR